VASFILADNQKVTLSVAFESEAGNPAKVDGSPTWESSDDNLLDLLPSSDGLSCVVMAAGALGTGQVNVQADADLGTGMKTISGVLDIEVVASEAVGIAINAGAPEHK
jgi:hypothetical protein